MGILALFRQTVDSTSEAWWCSTGEPSSLVRASETQDERRSLLVEVSPGAGNAGIASRNRSFRFTIPEGAFIEIENG
jgi:hypothetical protein